jgi:hypothetical protein
MDLYRIGFLPFVPWADADYVTGLKWLIPINSRTPFDIVTVMSLANAAVIARLSPRG